jgi:hypothetical protein
MSHPDEHLGAWHRILLGEANNVVYRLTGTAPTPAFYRDLAESLEMLAARVRREIQDSDRKQ